MMIGSLVLLGWLLYFTFATAKSTWVGKQHHLHEWTRDQQRSTISEVAADWHEPMVPQRIMWPSIARANEQLDPRCS